jgi:hypothetical protein
MRPAASGIAVFIAALASACVTNAKPPPPAVGAVQKPPVRLFTIEEVAAATSAARSQAMQEGLSKGRREAEPVAAAAFSNGFAKGESATIKRLDDEACVRAAEVRDKLNLAVTNFIMRTTVSSLLNGLTLKSDKATTMQAWQVLDLVTARLTDLGYSVRMLLPSDKVALVRQYEQARVYLTVSDKFRSRFVENFEKMTVLDGLSLLYRLYGFTVWVGESESLVWLGYFNAGPNPVPNTVLELRFDEDRIGHAVGIR